jgi:type IV secretory pathway protease TraF
MISIYCGGVNPAQTLSMATSIEMGILRVGSRPTGGSMDIVTPERRVHTPARRGWINPKMGAAHSPHPRCLGSAVGKHAGVQAFCGGELQVEKGLAECSSAVVLGPFAVERNA